MIVARTGSSGFISMRAGRTGICMFYGFAHELCHILSNYEEHVGEDTTKYNQWFEETLCETASLFALKSLADTWENSPPDPTWATQAKSLRRFFEHLIAEGHRQLPAHAPLSSWLQDNKDVLRQNPYLRDKNEVVANLLLPLFQNDPQNWDALTYLNLDPADARSSLEDYLRHWYQNAPWSTNISSPVFWPCYGRVMLLPAASPRLVTRPLWRPPCRWRNFEFSRQKS
ncbi:MAG: hypothetical protein IPP59_11525 [Betaproteobacteria bacterium]|nr:hypothetical protein [Candidatus Dechloromonas phosphorivorans]